MNKNFTIFSTDGFPIPISVYGLEHIERGPAVFFVHGFKGFKDWGFFPWSAQHLSNLGYCAVTFNFSHNGVTGNGSEFTEPGLFAENTFSREIGELEQIVTTFLNGTFGKKESGKLFFIGHSRGGAVALLTAARLPQISAVAVWAGISRLNRYSERQKAEWRERGFFSIVNSRTNQEFRLHTALLDDIEQNASGLLHLEYAARSLKRPLLLVHGEQDVTVPPAEAKELAQWAGPAYATLHLIKGTGHTFNAEHPLSSPPAKFSEVMEITKSFLNSVHN